ncbi:MAG: DNA polymerase III subunit delta [Gammaproteobacteria bacterium]|nr:DNA polymerase III subunit delta [Gammaproteobacteria bacterium]
MQCPLAQLPQRLAQGLAPAYLLFADEPLLVRDGGDLIRRAAAAAGYLRDLRLSTDGGFDWVDLRNEYAAMSLFASRRLIELELTGSQPNAEGQKLLAALADQPNPDIVLLIHGPRLNKDKLGGAGLKRWCELGVQVLATPPERQQWPAWVRDRARGHGVNLAADALALLAERCEGNLLAADQELAKLALLARPQPWTAAELDQQLAQFSRYSVFQLVDALLAGELPRALVMLEQLQAEESEPVVVLWAISREVLLLQALAEGGDDSSGALMRKGVWSSRQNLVRQALRRLAGKPLACLLARCNALDGQFKSSSDDDSWLWLSHLCLAFDPRWQAQEATFGAALRPLI